MTVLINHEGCSEQAALYYARKVWVTGVVVELTYPDDDDELAVGGPFINIEDEEEDGETMEEHFICGECDKSLSDLYVREHMIEE